MHSYHGEWVSVAEPQEDAFEMLTAASLSQQNQMNYGLKQPRRRRRSGSPLFSTHSLSPPWSKTKFAFIGAVADQW